MTVLVLRPRTSGEVLLPAWVGYVVGFLAKRGINSEFYDLNISSLPLEHRSYDAIIIIPSCVDGTHFEDFKLFKNLYFKLLESADQVYLFLTNQETLSLVTKNISLSEKKILDWRIPSWRHLISTEGTSQNAIYEVSPDWSGLRVEGYLSPYKSTGLTLPLLTSLGCSRFCSYCFDKKTFDPFPMEIVRRAILEGLSLGVKEYLIEDDQFNTYEHVNNFCTMIIEEKVKISWQAINGVYPIFDKNLIDLMIISGCRHVSLGVEHLDKKVLKRILRDFELKELKETISLFRDRKVIVSLYFMIGLEESTLVRDFIMVLRSATLNADLLHYSVHKEKAKYLILKRVAYLLSMLLPKRSFPLLLDFIKNSNKRKKIISKIRRVFFGSAYLDKKR